MKQLAPNAGPWAAILAYIFPFSGLKKAKVDSFREINVFEFLAMKNMKNDIAHTLIFVRPLIKKKW